MDCHSTVRRANKTCSRKRDKREDAMRSCDKIVDADRVYFAGFGKVLVYEAKA